MQPTVITHVYNRRNRRRIAVIVLLCYCGSLLAAPGGGQIVGGTGTISQSGALTQIHQQSERLAIDWQRFDVAADERVQFLQPSSQAIALNRILDTKASTILGRVDANGKLFLVNPRGLVFGKGSVVNAAALVATDLDIDPNKFMEGNYHFAGDDSLLSSGVINQGAIEAAVGGSVTLLGTVISNEGQIHADQGSVNLVAANDVVVSFEPEGQVGLLVNRALLTNVNGNVAAVSNSGEIIAAGGQVLLAGHVASDLYSQAVNNEGIIEATSMETGRGYIALLGEGATVTHSGELNVSGTGNAEGGEVLIVAGDIRNSGAIDASGSRGGSVHEQASVAVVHSQDSSIDATGSNGEGGTIELYGERVALIDTTRLDASGATGGGTILIGGDYQGAGDHRSRQTVVTRDVEMKADAIDTGDGGKVIVWSDDDTYFYGDIYARGGNQSGDGGFVEVSGKDGLQFVGYVNTSAANGAMGTLLLDPTTLNIVAGNGGTNNVQVNIDGEILAGDVGVSFTIDEDTLEALTSNVTLEAQQAINISSMSNGVLCFHCASEGGSGSGDVTFRVTGGSPGSITMDVNDRIEVANGNLTLQVSSAAGATLTLGDLMTTGSGGITVNALATSTGTTSGNVNLTVGDVTAASSSVSLVANTTNNPGFSAASSGTATLTAGQITLNSGGNVNIDAISSSNSNFSGADSGNASAVIGAIMINGAGNVTIDASTDAASSFSGVTVGSSSVSTGAINVAGAGSITLAANAVGNGSFGTDTVGTMTLSSGGASNNGAGTITLTATDGITLAGNFAAGSAGNNGFFNATGDSITLSGDTSIVMRNDGSGANPIIFNTSGANSIDGGNFDLTVNPDQANIAINWANFVAGSINTLTLGHANNIYIVAGGAGAGDITFTQADLNSFTSLASGLGFDASANVVIGNSSFNYGNVELTAGSAINVTGDVDPGAGNFTFTANAGTDFTMNAATSINSGNGAIAIDAGGNITLTSLTTTNATVSAVAITSTGGAIIDGDTVDDVDITATSGSVNLIAASGIGDDATATDYTLEINAAGVSASNSTANNIDLDLTGNVILDGALTNSAAGGGLLVNASTGSLTVDSGLTTANGIIDLNASTALTMNSGSSLDAGSATINLLASNDIVLTSLTTTNATASAVTVTSTGGAILDGDTVDDVDITATNGTVNLIAANGIGDDATATDYTLEINAAGVSASNSTANNIDLDLTGNVVLNGALTNSAAGGGLLVNASTGSLTVDSALTTANGIIDLAANTTLIMNSGSSLDAGNATINLLAANDIALTSLTTTNATASAVTVTSTGGAILDGDTVDDVDITATNGTVNLIAASGIGDDATATDYTLEINAAGVSASNSTANNIDLDLAGDVTLDGSLANSAIGGGLLVNAGGSLTVNTALSTNNGMVDLAAGTALTMNAGSAIDAGSATINLLAANDIVLTSLTTTNNTASAVTVTTTGGAILDGDTVDDVDITATNGTVNLIAANGIGDDATATDYTLEINAADVSASNSTTNNIDLDLMGNIILDGALTNSAAGGGLIVNASTGSLIVDSALTTADGVIDLTANTSLTMNGGSSLDAGNATINLLAANDIALTSLATTNATASAVTVTSTGGAILDGDTVDDVDITATNGTVNLIAANGIGDDATATDYTLEINAADVSATNSTANNIDLDLAGNIILDGALTNNAAGGGLLVNASTGSLTVDSVLTTTNGIIDLSANTALTMNAGSAIDAGNATVNLFAANNITLTSVTTTNATASAVTVTTTGGSILDGDTVDDVDITATSGTVNLIAANGIGDDATATDYTLEINASSVSAANSTANNIDLDLMGNIILDGALTNTAAGGGLIVNASTGSLIVDNALTTADGIIDLTANTSLTMNGGSSLDAGSATINLLAANDIVLTSLTTTNATASAVTVTSTAGTILDGDTVDDVDIAAINGTVNLTAANGIGTFADPLDLDTAGVVASTGSGHVMLTNVGNLAVTGLDTTNGDVNVSAGGDLQLNGIVSTGNGSVMLATAIDVIVNSSVTAANGNVQIDAGNHLILAATGSVNAGGGDVTLVADSGISDGVGALSIAAGGTVSGNAVNLQSAQTLSVTGIQGSSVTLTSGADIVDANAAALDITVTDSAGALTLNAATGVGVGDALETDTRLLVLASDVAQEISNTGNVAVSGLGSHSGGNVTVATTGDLTLATTVITDNSALDLTAGGAVNASALNSGGAVSVTATDLNIGSATVNSLTTAAAINVATSLTTTTTMTSGNLLLAANASVTSGDVLSAGSLTLANSGSAAITSTGDMSFTGISGTGSHLTLNSAANMTLGNVALGAGNFTAQVDSDANAVATLSATAVSAGNIALSGGVDSNDVLQVSGQMDGNDISVSGFGNLDLQRIVALGVLSLQGQTISLADDLQSRNGLYVFGDTTLLNNISLDSTGAGAVSGSKLELEGNWSGNGFDLSLDAGNHVACTTGANLSGIDNFVITDSIKTVLGQISANSIDVRSSQEIHLNESVTANTVVFNADSNGDGIGLLSVLTGRSINTPSLTLVGSTVQTTASTAANCDLPTGLPTIPNPQPDFRAIAEVVQEAERFEETALETFASNAPNITYLDSSCHPNRRGTKMHYECALDESVRNFLGTFLIDFQLPTN